MTTITETISAYRAGALSLEAAVAQIEENKHVPRASNIDSAWDFDGGEDLDDGFSLLASAHRTYALTPQEYDTFAAALSRAV